jgi:hypothetical protein
MTDAVEKAEQTIADLERKRIACVQRGSDLADERANGWWRARHLRCPTRCLRTSRNYRPRRKRRAPTRNDRYRII